jgi:peptidoglycan/xylan/chitin deacetylase (PgdA/CDA1 family)
MPNIIKSFLKRSIAFLYIQFGCVERAKKKIIKNQSIVSIYFHNPTFKTFNDCISWLINNGFDFLDIRELLKSKDHPLVYKKPMVIITIDDGWRDNLLNIVPIAHFNQIPVTIFSTTEPLIEGGGYWWSYIKAGIKKGITTCTVPFLKSLPNVNRLSILNHVKPLIHLDRESMTVEELKAIAISPYVQIGAHTISHPILPNCSDEIADNEICQSKSILEAILAKPVYSFSYPNGDYTERELILVEKHGYQLAFTTQPALIEPGINMDLLKLPRFEVMDDASLDENICRMTGVWFKK